VPVWADLLVRAPDTKISQEYGASDLQVDVGVRETFQNLVEVSMDEKEGAFGWLKALGLSIHEVFRYGYGGLLAYLVAVLVNPVDTKMVLTTLGTTISILLAFALGGVIYVGHRQIIGELLYLLHEWFHIKLNRPGRGCTCRSAYFVKRWHLSISLATEAFRTVRDSQEYDQNKQRRFHLQHSELHMLYVTFFVLSVGAFILWIRNPTDALISPAVLIIVALLALVSGFVGNILLCRQECKVLLLIPEQTIRELLVRAEFITSNDQSVNAAQQGAAAVNTENQ
jgi:uncharacterized membrane protein YqjE